MNMDGRGEVTNLSVRWLPLSVIQILSGFIDHYIHLSMIYLLILTLHGKLVTQKQLRTYGAVPDV